jgi:hypothetical protein
LTFSLKGPSFASIEGRSMVFGSIALCLYCALVCRLLVSARVSALTATVISLPVWFCIALLLQAFFPGQS